MHPSDTSELLPVAADLCRQAGRGRPVGLDALAGGKNNRVFRVALADGDALILKSYFHDPRDPRDRLAAEWGFLRYAWERGVRAIPEPIARDAERHAALYGLVPGRRPTAIGRGHVDAAAAFVIAVNAAPRAPHELAPGSEACFSIAQHIATVRRRLDRLSALEPSAEDRHLLDGFVSHRLLPAWQEVIAAIEAASADVAREIGDREQIVSPSDFGFHNALVGDGTGRLCFLDFEYGGRDDPAKLACDFFCQPEVPVPSEHAPHFVDRLADGLDLGEAFRQRCRLLLPLYRIKWATIILNQFMPLGATRRAFAAHEAAGGAQQIARAEAQVAAIHA